VRKNLPTSENEERKRKRERERVNSRRREWKRPSRISLAVFVEEVHFNIECWLVGEARSGAGMGYDGLVSLGLTRTNSIFAFFPSVIAQQFKFVSHVSLLLVSLFVSLLLWVEQKKIKCKKKS